VSWVDVRPAGDDKQQLQLEGEIMATYSVSFRLRRTVVEERYVSVPITDAVMQADPDEDGAYRVDMGKLVAAAIQLGQDDADWLPEEREVTLHPIQKAPDQYQGQDQALSDSTGTRGRT
jgi:hypothetical protein